METVKKNETVCITLLPIRNFTVRRQSKRVREMLGLSGEVEALN